MSKILIVDDERLLIRMVQVLLEANGDEVITACDGREGLVKAKTENIDLIILDVTMPKMGGFEVCSILKNDVRYNKIPIIIISALAHQDALEVGKDVGADAYIAKPFETPFLLAKIKELLKTHPTKYTKPRERDTVFNFDKKRCKEHMSKILIVDDERDVVYAVEMQLAAHNYNVSKAFDGEEGLKKARSENPDLIILDLMLPKLDGYKVCRLLKFDEKYKQIPIVLFTAWVQEEDQKLGYEVGADAYLVKPFEPPVLLAKIKELLKKSS